MAEKAIERKILAHTGLLDGDDSGYRDVPIFQGDQEDPDPMVVLTEVDTLPVYARGSQTGLCTMYDGGLGAPDVTLVRKPLVEPLVRANEILKPYGRKILVVDGWRSYLTQMALWKYLRAEIIQNLGLKDGSLTLREELLVGIKADDVGSFVACVKDEKFAGAKVALMTEKGDELAAASTEFGKPTEVLAELFLHFQTDLRRTKLTLEDSAVTAHGNGGAVDCWLLNTETGKPVNLGVGFDYFPPQQVMTLGPSPAVVNYFDMAKVNVEVFAAQVAADPHLQRYLSELGYDKVTSEVFAEAQRERRLLFHTMMEIGASYFSLLDDLGEPWHFNLGNLAGGKQAKMLPGSGNGCHALLKDIRHVETGERMAVWANDVAHRLARELLLAKGAPAMEMFPELMRPQG